jgi:nucleotide-binding universal stress UspA family protein
MFKRILLAIDDSESSHAAVSFAIAMARDTSAEVRVVHVNELIVGGRGFTVETQTEAMDHLQRAVSSLREAGVPTDGTLYVSNCFGVEERIANAAADWSADVIVLGSRRHGRFTLFSRFAGKGIRERVTNLTSLPILVAPEPLEVTLSGFGGLSEQHGEPLGDFPSIRI